MNDIVRYETTGRVALITLNRPEARNAVNGEVAAGLEAAVDRLEEDPDVWVGILTANTEGQERPVFCAGADLKAISAGKAGELATRRGGFGGFTYRDRVKPVIAAIDGLATAGGFEIATSCDLIVATTRSQFGLAEVKRNLIAGAGGLFRLPWVIGRAAAMEVVLTGEPITAERLFQLGMVNRLVGPGEHIAAAMDLASTIAANAPLAVWASRKVILAADGDESALRELTNTEFARVLTSEDTTEGLTAFIEKRLPQWKGR